MSTDDRECVHLETMLNEKGMKTLHLLGDMK